MLVEQAMRTRSHQHPSTIGIMLMNGMILNMFMDGMGWYTGSGYHQNVLSTMIHKLGDDDGWWLLWPSVMVDYWHGLGMFRVFGLITTETQLCNPTAGSRVPGFQLLGSAKNSAPDQEIENQHWLLLVIAKMGLSQITCKWVGPHRRHPKYIQMQLLNICPNIQIPSFPKGIER